MNGPMHLVHPCILQTNKLNNQGAQCLESGDYDEAITILIRALKLWEHVADHEACQCDICSLDECIQKSGPDTPAPFHQHDMASAVKSLVSQGQGATATDEDTMETDDRFIYRRPIYSSPQSEEEGHPPGVTLSLIIILNLAMAHHMSAIENNLCRRQLQKSLQFYELAHQLQLEEEICSPRATMIVANNVGEIHRDVQNFNKHKLCHQHLLSTMMYMIDCQVPVTSIELEGFFRNTSRLILHNNCASAA